MSDQYFWSGGGDGFSFDDPDNWTNNGTAPTSPPGAGNPVYFGSDASLQGGGVCDWLDLAATLTIDSCTITAEADITVGVYGAGNMMIDSAGSASANTFIQIGGPGEVGTIAVDGSGSNITSNGVFTIADGGTGSLVLTDKAMASTAIGFEVGWPGTGVFNIESGSQADGEWAVLGEFDASSQGSMTIMGMGSELTLSQTLTVGGDGSAALTVESGGSLNLTNSDVGTTSLVIGEDADSDATATLNGTQLTVNGGGITVGDLGQGTLFIEGQAMVDASGAGNQENDSIYVGDSTGALGSIVVDNSKLLIGTGLSIGNYGSGALAVQDGGSLQGTANLTNGVDVGESDGGSGELTLDGGTANFTALNSIALIDGDAGIGVINVMSQSTLTLTNDDLDKYDALILGNQSTGQGSLTVSGSGAVLNVTGDITVGNYGTGVLTIQNGGSLNLTEATADLPDIIVGSGMTGNGSINLNGSELDVINGISIGFGGTGAMTIQNGGELQANQSPVDTIEVGQVVNSLGSLNLTGSSSMVTSTDGVDIGDAGSGVITVQNTALFSVQAIAGLDSAAVYMGGYETGSGSLSFDAANGSIYSPDNVPLEVGDAGIGQVTVGAQSVLTVTTADPNDNYDLVLGNQDVGEGYFTVNGLGARANLTAGGIAVGDSGTGSLIIENNGSLTSNEPSGDAGLVGADVAVGSGAVGYIGVSQSNATFNGGDGTGLIIGDGGNGTVALSSGATVTANTNDPTGSTSYSLLMGNAAGSSGTLNINDGTFNANSGAVVIGNYGAAAVVVSSGLFNDNDASVSTAGWANLEIGENAGSSGTLSVTNALVDLSGQQGVFDGDGGSGTVNVGTGGTLTATGLIGGFTVGESAGGVGSLDVSGAGASFTASSPGYDGLVVGDYGNGNATFEQNAVVNTSTQNPEYYWAASVGNRGGTGTLTIETGASYTANGGGVSIGNTSQGSLQLQSGGTLTINGSYAELDLGSFAGSQGAATVTGTGSVMNVYGALYDGDQTKGSLTISNGGLVNVYNSSPTDVGTQSGSTGALNIAGSNALLVTDTLNIGMQHGGVGTMTLGEGGGVYTNFTNISNDSSVSMEGGTLTANGSLTVNTDNTLSGYGTLDAEVDLAGTITAAYAGTLDIAGNVTDDEGSLVINPGSALQLDGTLINAPDIYFTPGSPETLRITTPTLDVLPNIHNFDASGDTLDLTALNDSTGSAAYTLSSSDVLTVSSEGDSISVQLDPADSYSGLTFQTGEDSSDGTDVTISAGAAPCYLTGTRIRTDRGEVAIETLRIGDRVVLGSGAIQPIRWIGRRSYPAHYATAHPKVLPVRIGAGALGLQLPARDLWVSPEHALWIEGVLVPAGALINGVSIAQEDRCRDVDYFHLEFDAHALVYAEGALAESFVDDHSRGQFDNVADFYARYPNAWPVEACFCAPRLEDGWELERLRRSLALLARSALPQTPGNLRAQPDRECRV